MDKIIDILRNLILILSFISLAILLLGIFINIPIIIYAVIVLGMLILIVTLAICVIKNDID